MNIDSVHSYNHTLSYKGCNQFLTRAYTAYAHMPINKWNVVCYIYWFVSCFLEKLQYL